jgi:hypothetical protein
MTWFKVDDGLAFHAKVVQAGNPAMGLWVRAGSWSAQQLTDGFIPQQIALTLGTKGQAATLVTVGLWALVDSGYQIHDYLSYNPTADEVRADQARKHEAKVKAGRVGGVASGIARRKQTRSSDEAEAKQNGSKTKPRPVPSRPDLSSTDERGGSHVSRATGSAPPAYPDHCADHQEPVPPKCGGCMKQKELNRQQGARLPDYRLRVVPPLCGECDERWIETPDGLAKCPNCYPQEMTA